MCYSRTAPESRPETNRLWLPRADRQNTHLSHAGGLRCKFSFLELQKWHVAKKKRKGRQQTRSTGGGGKVQQARKKDGDGVASKGLWTLVPWESNHVCQSHRKA